MKNNISVFEAMLRLSSAADAAAKSVYSNDVTGAVSLLDASARDATNFAVALGYIPSDDESVVTNADAPASEKLFSFAVAVNTASTMLEEFCDLKAARRILEDASDELFAAALNLARPLTATA